MQLKRRVLTSILAIGAIAIITGVAIVLLTTPHSAPTKTIKIAFNTWIGYSSFYIAEKEGLFGKYGLKIETAVIDPLAEKNAGMLRGDLDGMGGTIDSSVISATNGLSAAIVMMFDRSNGTDGILVTDDVKSVKDLAGKSIAVEEGFVGHFFLLYVLDKAGVELSSVRIIPMSTDEAGTAFAAGKVDVAVTWEPLLSTAKSRPGSRVLVSSADVEPILADTLFLSRKIIQERPVDVKNLVLALMEANSMWKKDQGKYLPFIAEKWQLKPDEITTTMQTVQLYDCSDQLRLFGPDHEGPLYEYVTKASNLWLKSGVTKLAPGASTLVEPRFVREACR